jgi:excisionase family DNA binding protein
MISHLTQDEVATRLRLSPRTLERWRQTNEVQLPYLKCGSKVRYRLEDVEAYELAQLRSHTSELALYAGHPKLR